MININMELTAILQALGDPIRLRIVGELADGEPRPCGSFGHLGVGAPTISHHFKVLREAGLVETEVQGSKRLNTLRREAVDADFPGLLDSVLEAAWSMKV
jgi:DNA-binding transcriptional ArsR family regulator